MALQPDESYKSKPAIQTFEARGNACGAWWRVWRSSTCAGLREVERLRWEFFLGLSSPELGVVFVHSGSLALFDITEN